MTRFHYPTPKCHEATDDTGYCVAHETVHTGPRLTRDLCQDDWQAAHPDEYFPNVTRYGTCAQCGQESVLVARSRIEDEEPGSPGHTLLMLRRREETR